MVERSPEERGVGSSNLSSGIWKVNVYGLGSLFAKQCAPAKPELGSNPMLSALCHPTIGSIDIRS